MEESIQRAVELRRESQYTEALAILLDLYDKHPDHPRVSYELACTYDTQGVEDEAIGFYEHAIQCGLEGDDLRGAMLGLGSSYRCVERYGDSARILQKGAATFPDAREFDIFLALTRHNMGEHDEALRLLLGHIADHSADSGAVRYRRAISYYAEHLNPPYDD